MGQVGKFIDPTYTYDANGNLSSVTSTNGQSRTHFFTSFNMPLSLGATGASAAFAYSSDYARVRENLARTVNGVVKTRTVYQLHPDKTGGLSYEREIKEDGTIEHRHYVAGVAVLITKGDGATQSTITSTRYWHKDHLGSIVAVTNEAGAVVERMAYDPFGKRRYIKDPCTTLIFHRKL